MKIARLEIEGFRSLRKVVWEPGDLNVVIGPNGSGKSNLLRFLELMAVSAQGRLGKYIQSLGGMEAIVWDGEANWIKFSLDTSDIGEAPLKRYLLAIKRLGYGRSYRINSELFTDPMLNNQQSGSENICTLARGSDGFKVSLNDTLAISNIFEIASEEESSLCTATGLSIAFYHKSIPEFRSFLAAIAVYHNFRTDENAPIRQSTVARFETRLDPDGQNLISVLHTLYTSDRDFKNDINAAMYAAFGEDFDELVFPPASDHRIQLKLRWKSLKREQSAADLSDGTLRFLFLLTALSSPDLPPIVAIDEPETGLHPSMLSIVAECAYHASKRSQIILSTHSPQFLDAFTETQPTTTVMQWENGETVLRVLPKEELDYWLQEYSLGALFKTGELENMG